MGMTVPSPDPLLCREPAGGHSALRRPAECDDAQLRALRRNQDRLSRPGRWRAAGGPARRARPGLGGLGKSRQLVLLDPRGVGLSADPADQATFGVARLVSDVESLRAHLGLDRMDLLAHSAASVLATLYAAA